MNKKFSTLVASLLLATTVGTGYAQVQKGTISERPDMAYINAIEEGKFYQLTNGTKVLIMEQASNGTYVLKYVDFNKAELAKSLWSIKAEKKGASGLVFQFVNLASGLPISFDSDEIKGNGVTPISEGTNQWVWARGVAGNAANQFYAMEAFFGAENDSVMTLTSGRDGVVSAFRYATKDFSQQIADRRLKFVAKEAREVYLNAYDLNTMLQTMPEDKLQLTFNAEPKKAQLDNEFTIRQYKAEDAVAENSWSKGSVEDLKDKMEAADAAMEKANLAYYAKVKEGSEADAALRELLAGWDKVGQRVDQLEEATKNAEIVQKKAYETYEEYANDVAALQAQIAESESSEELLEKLTEAQEALEDANEKLSAAENKQIELKNIAKEKEDAYNDAKWGDKVKLYMEWQKALLGLKEHEKTLPSLRAAVDLAEANVDSAADNLAAGSELASELSAAINKRDNAKGEYDKKLSAYEDLDAQLTEAKLEEAGLYAKVDASTEDVNGIIAEVSRLLRIKKAATRWYFVAVDNYASAQSMGENWLSLWTGTKDAKGRKQYLMVDTAYMEDASVLGDKHQKFAITHYDDFSNYCSHVANYRDINGRFNFRYLNIAGNLSVQIGNKAVGEDTILRVAEGEGTKFVFEMAKPAVEKYGVDKAFEKGQYYIRVNDADKLTNNFKYVQISEVDGTEMLVVAGKETATPFYLKEVNCDENGVHYYALLAESKKAGVIDASGLIKAENLMIETRTSAFAVNELKTRFYREFTEEELSNNNMLKFYRTASTEKEYLYAAAPENDMTFLAVEGKGDNAAAAAEMTVIPTTEAGVLMPQYFIARNVVEQAGAIDFCGEEHKALEDSLACPHTKFVPDTVFGDFLVNLKIDTKKYGKYNWEGQYTRLAFLKGYAVKEKGVLPGEGEYTKLYIDGKEVSADNAHSATKFEFRLVNDNEEQDFLIESESHNKTYFDGGVRPKDGGWVKIQNGVPVIVAASYENAIQGDVFNADVAEGGATANDEITTSEITVIAGEGNVTIANAAGKKVVVSNILGQIVATQVLISDNAVIAAPQGVVVVAVEGEEAVKAIVK